jgi:hypothetical protein
MHGRNWIVSRWGKSRGRKPDRVQVEVEGCTRQTEAVLTYSLQPETSAAR